MTLTKEQSKQVQKQLLDHRHERHNVDIDLDAETALEGLIVFPNVLRPDRVTGLYLARYLYSHPKIYTDKTVIDMGSGSGLQGIVTGMYGAKKVLFSDISKEAYENTVENVKKFNLENKSEVFNGNLFEHINTKADVIIFNHPFFPGTPIGGEPVSVAMLDDGGLLQKFLLESRKFLSKGGIILMPYFLLAGPTNNPSVQAWKHGYTVRDVFECDILSGLQKGTMSIYELK